MDASPVLVDSSWFIHWFRRGEDPLPKLAIMAATRDLVACGVVRVEVGRGIKVLKARSRFAEFCDSMIQSPCDSELWNDVEETLWGLDRQGVTLPLTDVFIACSALRVGASVLTYDKHFLHIPKLSVIQASMLS
jgi:predicted nucleic acid-binding protein